MSAAFQERRRSPRSPADGRCEFRLGSRVAVRLLDISGSGALLASVDRLPVGGTGRLRLLFGTTPFEATMEVTREGPSPSGPQRISGVAMVHLDAAHRVVLEDFLRRAGA